MKLLLPSLLTLMTTSLASAATESTHLAGRANKVPGPPGYASVADNDPAMDHAAIHARRSLGFFVAALHAKKPGDRSFEVKKAYVDGNHVEHLWIGSLTFDGKNFHGRINNKPLDVHNVRLGQTVVVAPHEVTDWMFVKDGKLIGGYSTRVLYARLSPENKARFNKEADFTVQ